MIILSGRVIKRLPKKGRIEDLRPDPASSKEEKILHLLHVLHGEKELFS
jgi:hypothetical protein